MELNSELLNRLADADLIVAEGFEMTGKSHLLSMLQNIYPSINYRPNWEEVMPDTVLSRGNRFVPGVAIVDFWKSIKSIGVNHKLIIDRWFAVSYVYQSQYSQATDVSDISALINAYYEAVKGLSCVILHKYHASKEDARIMYELSTADQSHADVYDMFDSFEDYYEVYLKFETTYRDFYEKYCKDNPNISVLYLEAYSNKLGGE